MRSDNPKSKPLRRIRPSRNSPAIPVSSSLCQSSTKEKNDRNRERRNGELPAFSWKHFLVLFYLIQASASIQINRIIPWYPGPSIATPYNFQAASSQGAYLPEFGAFVHADFQPTTPGKIYLLSKDGQILISLPGVSKNTRGLSGIRDKVLTFSSNDDIKMFTVTSGPVSISLSMTDSVSHNLNLRFAWKDKDSDRIYVSTANTGFIHSYDFGAYSTPLQSSKITLSAGAVINKLIWTSSNFLAAGGTSMSLTFIQKSDLFPISSSSQTQILNMHIDTLEPIDSIIIDIATTTTISRYNFTSNSQGSLLFQKPITNSQAFVEFSGLNYLLSISGLNSQLFIRSTYETIDEILNLGGLVDPLSTACCYSEFQRQYFSVSFVKTSTLPRIFKSFIIDLNFCTSYKGDVCTACYKGYTFDSLDTASNKCLSPLDFPVGFGNGGASLGPCLDKNCKNCRANSSECRGCLEGYLLDPFSASCVNLTSTPSYGLNPANFSEAFPCEDFGCKTGFI